MCVCFHWGREELTPNVLRSETPRAKCAKRIEGLGWSFRSFCCVAFPSSGTSLPGRQFLCIEHCSFQAAHSESAQQADVSLLTAAQTKSSVAASAVCRRRRWLCLFSGTVAGKSFAFIDRISRVLRIDFSWGPPPARATDR